MTRPAEQHEVFRYVLPAFRARNQVVVLRTRRWAEQAAATVALVDDGAGGTILTVERASLGASTSRRRTGGLARDQPCHRSCRRRASIVASNRSIFPFGGAIVGAGASTAKRVRERLAARRTHFRHVSAYMPTRGVPQPPRQNVTVIRPACALWRVQSPVRHR